MKIAFRIILMIVCSVVAQVQHVQAQPCPGGTDIECDDGIACTFDQCDVGPLTCFAPVPNDALCDDLVACTDDVCNVLLGCQFTANDANCNDGVACTDDVCDALLDCQFTANDANCNDFVACTDDVCDLLTDCSFTPNDANCTDGVTCTDDICNLILDCIFTANDANCTDAVPCTDDVCDALLGCQFTANDANCTDGVSCTDDVCDAILDCQFTANDANCNDFVACSDDVCDAVLDCQFTPNNGNCNDLVPCTDDICNLILDCIFTANDANCTDAVPCTDDVCDALLDCQFTANNANCTDGVSCTDDVCDALLDCQFTANNANCNDFVTCTDDVCDLLTDCSFTPNDANCTDGVACTDDVCSFVLDCQFTPNNGNCTDGVDCTDDVCDLLLGCQFTANNANCTDGVACTDDVCNLLLDCQFTANNGNCNDFVTCTDDVCDLLTDCSFTPNDANCSDGVACTDDVCSFILDCQFTPNNGNCTDGVTCTDDVCDALLGCQFTANNANCDDGVACTDDVCDVLLNCQLTANNANCNDFIPCTDDVCNLVTDCGYTPNDANCTDGVACTDDVCNLFLDCIFTANDANCTDGVVCTDDACDALLGCQFTANDSNCDDFVACTDDVCNVLLGCQFNANNANCTDGVACTDDVCDALLGCQFTANDANCDDGIPCTDNTCSPVINCIFTENNAICSDGDPCTNDICDALLGGCLNIPNVCNDNNACTIDQCVGGSCVYSSTICNDGDACTTDGCIPLTGCTTTPLVCDDGSACTTDGCSSLTGCTTAPIVCDDLDACTTDGCATLSGCTTTPLVCDDVNACTTDGCNSLTGCTASPIVCDDLDACTTDGCNPLSGCTITPVVCDDADVCNGLETCDNLLGCQPGTALVCVDGNLCTSDNCDTGAGCVFALVPVPLADFTTNNICLGEQAVFTNTTTVPANPGLVGSLSYQWDFGDGAGSTDLNPVHLYADTFAIFTVTLTATSNVGCTHDTSKTLIVFPLPFADFSISASCYSANLAIGNLDTIASGSVTWHWDFDDGTTSTDSIPVKSYNSLGTYNITHTVTSDQGCVSSVTKSTTVFPNPSANFIATNVCEGDSTQFTNLSAIPAGNMSYVWNFGDNLNSTDDNPKHSYASEGIFPVTLTAKSDALQGGCENSITKDVEVYPKPAVEFSVAPVCEGTISVFNNTSSVIPPSTIILNNWNFGDGGASLDIQPTHLYDTAGTYLVTLTLTTNDGCVNSGSQAAVVNSAPEVFISPDKPLSFCVGGDVTLFALAFPPPPINSYTYEWNTSATDSNILVTNAGTYCTTVTDQNGCATSACESVTIYSLPLADFTTNNICLGEQAVFTNTTTFPANPGLLGSLSYQWDFGDTASSSNSSTDLNPVHLYSDTFDIFTVTLTATSNVGCAHDTSKTLIVFPLPFADFSIGASCYSANLAIGNLDTIAYGSMFWHWDFDDGTTSTDSIPVKSYNSLGTYNITHTVTSDQGCVSNTSKSTTVFPNPSANFIATNVCEEDSTQFTNLSAIPAGNMSYVWNFGDNLNSTDDNPKHSYASEGIFPVTLTAKSDALHGGCENSITKDVEVYPKPAVEFSVTPVCEGTISVFNNTSSVIPPSTIILNNWNFGDGGASLDIQPTHLYDTAGTYLVILTLTTNKGCVNSGSQAAVVNSAPEVFVSHDKPLSFCVGGDVTLFALAFPPPPINSYTYEWTNSATDSNILVTSAGTYCTTVTDQNGCAASACESVTIYSLPPVDVAATPTTISKGFPVQLVATEADGYTYAWSADQSDAGISDPGIKNPSATPQQTTTFTVTVTDAQGCQNTASVTVTVVPDYFVNPINVITPNGDPFNQTWFIENIQTYRNNQVLIFDRWGTKIFDMKAYDNSWDGTYNGKDLPQGTYYYVIKFDVNDTPLYKGSVSIIR